MKSKKIETPILLNEQALIDSSINEVLLFHGTSEEVAQKLLKGSEITWEYTQNLNALAFVSFFSIYFLIFK